MRAVYIQALLEQVSTNVAKPSQMGLLYLIDELDEGKGVKSKDLAELLNEPSANTRVKMSRLNTSGYIEKVDTFKYRTTSKWRGLLKEIDERVTDISNRKITLTN